MFQEYNWVQNRTFLPSDSDLDLGILCKCRLLVSLLAHFCIFSGVHICTDTAARWRRPHHNWMAKMQVMESSRMSGQLPSDLTHSDWRKKEDFMHRGGWCCFLVFLSEFLSVFLMFVVRWGVWHSPSNERAARFLWRDPCLPHPLAQPSHLIAGF